MLSIRMQRLGRKGHSMYRIVVQDNRRAPTSGKYVALLGSYDPHNKTSTITKDKAELYLKNGAQPSDRVVQLFKSEKISLPKWVKAPTKKKQEIRNPDKLRKNRPAEEKPEESVVEASTEAPSEETAEASTEENNIETSSAASDEASAETPAAIEAETALAEDPKEANADDLDKGNDETKTPPNEDEFPEDKKADTESKKA
jgi:small subunit ribosomal protein S16